LATRHRLSERYAFCIDSYRVFESVSE